jgi:amino acid permease
MLAVCGLIAVSTLYLVGRVCVETGSPTYGVMVEKVLGSTGGAMTSVVVMLQCFLVTIAYSITLSGTMTDFLRTWDISCSSTFPRDACDNPMVPELGRNAESNRKVLTLIIAVFVLWPVSIRGGRTAIPHCHFRPL